MSSEVFSFGGCELHPASRRLLVDGIEHALEPRPFDVLAHLVRQRHRCVGRAELLREFWHPASASASGLTRAIMKIRQVVDRDPRESLVRTLQRAGYQFVGQVDVAAAATPLPDGVALLPFENCTGLPDLDWVELGLMSLVARDLPRHAPVNVLPPGSVLSALHAVSAPGDVAARMATVRRLLAADRIVFADLHVDGPRYRLRCTLFPPEAQALEITSDEPGALAGLLARRLAEHWFPLRPRVPERRAADDLAGRRRLARAMQASAAQQWSRALGLLDEMLLADPHDVFAKRERLRALVALDDNRAFELGEVLLREATLVGDGATAAAVHLELANAYVRRRLAGQAKRHLDAALSRAGSGLAPAELFATTLLRSSIAMTEFDFARSARLLDLATRQCGLHGNVLDQIRLTSLRVIYEAETGDMQAAHEHALACASMYRDHGVLAGHARALSTLANASASLGRFDAATRHAETGLALSRSLGIPTDTALTVSTLCGLYRHLRRPADLDRALAALHEIDTGASPRNDVFHLVAHAQHETVHGRLSGALRCLVQAREAVAAAGQHLELHFVLPLLAGTLVGCGQLIEAEQTCSQIERLPCFQRDRNLQGALLHCRAQLAHALDDRVHALALLRAAIDVTPPGWWHAHARKDSAWLLLEADRAEDAAGTVAPIGQWLQEHPIGQLVHRRLSHARGVDQDTLPARPAIGAGAPAQAYFDEIAAVHERPGGRPAAAAHYPRAARLATCL